MTNANSAAARLLEEGRGPPGADKDDAVIVLQVEASAAGLQLDQKHVLLSIGRVHLAGVNGIVALLRVHTAMILQNRADEGEGLKEGREQLHLLMELAEDDPAIRLTGLITVA